MATVLESHFTNTDMLDTARALMKGGEGRADIPVPSDVVVADEFSADAGATNKAVEAVSADELILDIGPDTAARFAEILKTAGTIIWNGPVGVFEFDRFRRWHEGACRGHCGE